MKPFEIEGEPLEVFPPRGRRTPGCGQLMQNIGRLFYQAHLQHPKDNSHNGYYYRYLRIAENNRAIFPTINPHWWQ